MPVRMLWWSLSVICLNSGSTESTHLRTLQKMPENAAVCLSSEECSKAFRSMNTGGDFFIGDFPDKGCFTKYEHGYYGTGGTDDEIAAIDLPGARERIWCERETALPTSTASKPPTEHPTLMPATEVPTLPPSNEPTANPTPMPVTESPSKEPTEKPVTDRPTMTPSHKPTASPTSTPSKLPTEHPTLMPATEVSSWLDYSVLASYKPSNELTTNPTLMPVTESPSKEPTEKSVTDRPSCDPSHKTTADPTPRPTTQIPTSSPSSTRPSLRPSSPLISPSPTLTLTYNSSSSPSKKPIIAIESQGDFQKDVNVNA